MLSVDPNLSFFRGRVALYTALQAMDIKPGDEVILPGYTCIVVPNAIIYLGAKPVYIDIDPRSFNIDPSLIESRIAGHTRAIIAQHTYGIPAEMDQIAEIAKRHGLYVIEDCCHAIGSAFKGCEVGTFGDVAFYSSQWSKPFTTGLGGWAVVNDPELRRRMSQIQARLAEPSLLEILQLRVQYFLHQRLFRPSLFWFAQDSYRFLTQSGLTIGSACPGEVEGCMPPRYAMKMSRWQKGRLQHHLDSLDHLVAHRKMITRMYEEGLRAIGARPVEYRSDLDPVFLRYPVMVTDKPRALALARKARIELGDWFLSPVHPNQDRWEAAGYEKGSCPLAEDICAHVVNLPTHARVNAKEAARNLEFITGHVET